MAAETFGRALALVLKHEGGYVNHPRDPGGPTNLGITLETARRHGVDVDGDGDTDIVDIKRLRRSDAAKIYRAEYWAAVRGDQLPAGVDYAVFDFAANSGTHRAAMALQRVLGVADDGIIGPITLKAARDADPSAVIVRLCGDRLAFLRRLSTWPVFGKGWTSRVNGAERQALAMVTNTKPAARAA